jgi:protease-4
MSTDAVPQSPAPEPQPQPQPPAPPQPAAARKAAQGKTVSRVVFWVLLVGVPLSLIVLIVIGLGRVFSFSSPALEEKNYSKRLWTSGRHKIAIIHLDGTIMSGEGFIKKQIEQVIDDTSIKGVVFRVNSPGGLVTASDHIYQQLLKMRKERATNEEPLPMVVSMGGMAASGGYYVSMAVGDTPNSIYAEPSTWTGSIGVIIPHYNAFKFMKEHGFEEDSVRSHDLKGMGSFAKEMSPEVRAIFQKLVDESFADFKQIVKQGRPNLTDEQISALATGQVYTTRQALSNGLVDQQGYLEDAIRGLIKLAELDEDHVRVVEYKRETTLLDLLGAKAEPQKSELAALIELTKPQAYYLAPGWLPIDFRSFKD